MEINFIDRQQNTNGQMFDLNLPDDFEHFQDINRDVCLYLSSKTHCNGVVAVGNEEIAFKSVNARSQDLGTMG